MVNSLFLECSTVNKYGMIVGNIDRTPCAFQNQINVDVVPVFYERDAALAILRSTEFVAHVMDYTEPGSGVGFRLDGLL